MHAVVVRVTINNFDAARQALQENIVPMVSKAPGFVTGYWLAPQDGHGLSVAVFESEDNARAMAEQVQPPPGGDVTLDSVEVREVVAHA